MCHQTIALIKLITRRQAVSYQVDFKLPRYINSLKEWKNYILGYVKNRQGISPICIWLNTIQFSQELLWERESQLSAWNLLFHKHFTVPWVGSTRQLLSQGLSIQRSSSSPVAVSGTSDKNGAIGWVSSLSRSSSISTYGRNKFWKTVCLLSPSK